MHINEIKALLARARLIIAAHEFARTELNDDDWFPLASEIDKARAAINNNKIIVDAKLEGESIKNIQKQLNEIAVKIEQYFAAAIEKQVKAILAEANKLENSRKNLNRLNDYKKTIDNGWIWEENKKRLLPQIETAIEHLSPEINIERQLITALEKLDLTKNKSLSIADSILSIQENINAAIKLTKKEVNDKARKIQLKNIAFALTNITTKIELFKQHRNDQGYDHNSIRASISHDVDTAIGKLRGDQTDEKIETTVDNKQLNNQIDSIFGDLDDASQKNDENTSDLQNLNNENMTGNSSVTASTNPVVTAIAPAPFPALTPVSGTFIGTETLYDHKKNSEIFLDAPVFKVEDLLSHASKDTVATASPVATRIFREIPKPEFPTLVASPKPTPSPRTATGGVMHFPPPLSFTASDSKTTNSLQNDGQVPTSPIAIASAPTSTRHSKQSKSNGTSPRKYSRKSSSPFPDKVMTYRGLRPLSPAVLAKVHALKSQIPLSSSPPFVAPGAPPKKLTSPIWALGNSSAAAPSPLNLAGNDKIPKDPNSSPEGKGKKSGAPSPSPK